MIERLVLTKKNRIELSSILDFLLKKNNSDLYYTENNNRIFITDLKSLKRFLKESSNIYVKKDRGNYLGFILIWKSVGANVKRHYVKIVAKDYQTAKDLITVLLWNFNKELFIKIRKDNEFINAFKEKGFRFLGSRGIQILLNRKPIDYKKLSKKEES